VKYHLSIFLIFIAFGAHSQSPAFEPLAAGDNFEVQCTDPTVCGANVDPKFRALGQDLVSKMEAGKAWVENLGFPTIVESALEPGQKVGTRRLRLQADALNTEPRCINAEACHITNFNNSTRIILPLDANNDYNADPDTLVHEYVHSIQPIKNTQNMDWVHESVAAAIGNSYGQSLGASAGIYPPDYYITLDRPFYEIADPGYGNAPYLLEVGKRRGSAERVDYLTNSKIFKVLNNLDIDLSKAFSGMQLFYDNEIVGNQTFDKVFPEYVARFNNIEENAESYNDVNLDSLYLYYKNLQREGVDVPNTGRTSNSNFAGSVQTYSAKPILLSLDITSNPAISAQDSLMMARIKFPDENPDGLTLVVEHKISDRPGLQMAMIDGQNPPDDLGFIRVVNAPKSFSGEAVAVDFELSVEVRPIAINLPSCAQVGKPFTLMPVGFSENDASNWKLTTSNGTVMGLTATPANVGNMDLKLEIDSLVTRGSTGISPVKPTSSTVDIGSVTVQAQDCMVRMIMDTAVLTYNSDGEYTEFASPAAEAMYIGDQGIILWDGSQWRNMPANMTAMIVSRMIESTALLQFEFPGEHENEGIVMPRLPSIFSQRFSWSRLQRIRDADGNPIPRQKALCPDGGTGCTTFTFQAEGRDVPVLFDSSGKPVTVGFGGATAVFEYGTFQVRRPPGW